LLQYFLQVCFLTVNDKHDNMSIWYYYFLINLITKTVTVVAQLSRCDVYGVLNYYCRWVDAALDSHWTMDTGHPHSSTATRDPQSLNNTLIQLYLIQVLQLVVTILLYRNIQHCLNKRNFNIDKARYPDYQSGRKWSYFGWRE